MNKFHRILSAVIVFAMCFSLAPVSALALELPELGVLEDVVEAVEAEEEPVEEVPAEEEIEEPVEETELELESEAEADEPAEPTVEEIEAENPIDVEHFEGGTISEVEEVAKTLKATTSRYAVINSVGATGETIVAMAKKFDGALRTNSTDHTIRTGYGNPMAFDCSGYVARVLKEVGLTTSSAKYPDMGKDSNGNYYITAETQYQKDYGEDIQDAVNKCKNGDYSALEAGDLLFFSYNGGSSVSHVGIYDGNGGVWNSTSSNGVKVTSLNETGWPDGKLVNSLYWGCRLVKSFDYRNSWPCDLTFEIKTSCNAWTMPGSDSTYPDSEKVTSGNLAVGTKLVATEIYENTAAGHYWYKTTVNGEPAYVYVPYTKNATQNWNVSVSNVKKPTEVKLTDSFNIGGIVKTSGSLINSIRAFVYPGTTYQGGAYVICSDTVNPNSATYDLSKETNYTLPFGAITSTGYYTYIVHTILKSYTLNGYDVPTEEIKVVILDDTKSYFQVVNKTSTTTKYTVTFNANGGSCSETSRTVTSGNTIGTLPTPTRSGYVFQGWYTASSGGTKVTSSTKITANTTLYAHWKTIYCTITFDANGGNCDVYQKTVEYGAVIGDLPKPTRPGYVFCGWRTSEGYNVSPTGSVVTEDITLCALWKVVSGEVTASSSSLAIEIGTSAIVSFKCTGDLNDCDLSFSCSNDNLSCSWGTWTGMTSYLIITGNFEGTTCVTVSLIDPDTGTVLDIIGIDVEVWVPDYGVEIDSTNFPDYYFRQYVSENCDKDQNGYLSPTEIEATTIIDCSDFIGYDWDYGQPGPEAICSLAGIEYFTALEHLNCEYNGLSDLDLSSNQTLTILECGFNELTELNLSYHTALTFLDCSYNNLTTLDVSHNPALTKVVCWHNNLTSLDLRNNTALTYVDCSFNEITTLDLSSLSLLNELQCQVNQLTELDTSQNENLEYLYTTDNDLTKLDIRNNHMLVETYEGGEISDTGEVIHISLPGYGYLSYDTDTMIIYSDSVLYTVHYDANGGSGAPEDQACSYGDALTISWTKPVRDGHTFLGWSADANATEPTYGMGGSYTINADLTLYAVWKTDSLTGSCGENLIWTLTEDGVLTISGTGAMDEYNLDQTPWYQYGSIIREIHIENGINSIGSYAFTGFTALAGISIPEGVESIGEYAFDGCVLLASISLPSSLTFIDFGAFLDCNSLTTVEYAGSEENWYNISIQPLNTCLWTAMGLEIPRSGTCGENLTWFLSEDNVLTISGNGTMYDFFSFNYPEIPWYDFRQDIYAVTILDGVTSIGDYAFADCISIETVDIPDSVTRIGCSAFSLCNSLTSVALPKNLTELGERAFSQCWDLTSVELPDSITILENFVFYECLSLTNIDIPVGVISIGDGTFYECSLATVVLPDEVTSIGDSAFRNCEQLTSVKIPITIHDIGSWAFDGCEALSEVEYSGTEENWYEITIGDGNENLWNAIGLAPPLLTSGTCGEDLTWVLSDDGVLTISGTGEMYTYTYESYANWYPFRENITSVVIESGVTSIGEYAFYQCVRLSSVSIPASVTSIPVNAFEYCTGMLRISVDSENAYFSTDDEGVLFNKNKTVLMLCPEGKSGQYTIPNGVRMIGDNAFYLCTVLTDVSIPNSVISVGVNAFGCCTSLTSVSIPAGVTSIPNYAFNMCTSLTSISIHAGITSIGSGAFRYCDSLTEISVDPENANYSSDDCGVLFNKDKTVLILCPGGKSDQYAIPDSVKTIKFAAFQNCTGLTGITIPDSVTTIEEQAFDSCTSLTDITIGTGVTIIADSAFRDCSGLTSICIPDSVTAIEACAFMECTALTEITIPSSVQVIKRSAFSDCTALSSVTIMPGVKSIGESAFAGCTSLSFVSIPEGVTTLGETAFYGCFSLTHIVIPSTVVNIGYATFAYSALQEIVILNPDCSIYNDWSTLWGCNTVYGYAGSPVESYAATYGINFVDINHEHNYSLLVTEPNCTEQGYTTYTCTECGESYVGDETEATGHKPELQNVADPTCTKGGYTGDLVCAVCGKTTAYGQEVEAVGHTEVTDAAVAATCTKTGLTEGSHCSVCGEVLVKQEELPVAEHSWDEGEVTKEPTTSAEGERTYTCSVCGETKTEVIPMLAGDINGDDMITALDMVLMMKHIVGDPDTDITEEEADFNNDGKTDILDVIRLMRYLAGHDVKLQ